MKPPEILFKNLPDDSRIWIHATDRKLSESETEAVTRAVDQFLQSWTSHEKDVQGDFLLLENQILILAAFVPDGELSGCGIDKHLHVIDKVAENCAFNWTGALSVLYRDTSGEIAVAQRSEFRQIVTEQKLPLSTRIFDQSISSMSEVRRGIERAAGSSWHAGQFPFYSKEEKTGVIDQTSPALQ